MLVVVVISPETGASRAFTIAAYTSNGTAGQNVYYISGLSLNNPQHACHAARVTIVVLCVCMCVCMCPLISPASHIGGLRQGFALQCFHL